MDFLPNTSEKLLSVTLVLAQYPILAGRIRARMRDELYRRGLIDAMTLEKQVKDEAIQSQKLEGVNDPLGQEPAEQWELRKSILRDHLTTLLFSRHLPFELLEKIINEVLTERGVSSEDFSLSLNPELAPLDLVFEQALLIENMPEQEKARYIARLEESKVVLIRALISDQLRYINIAKEWLTINDLAEIRRRKIGAGRIGGKSAGMILAQHILKNNPDLRDLPEFAMPESYYIGSDEFYTFMSINNLFRWNDQKYKTETEMREDFPAILKEFSYGVFPPDILDRLQTMLIKIGKQPLIVRSSSLLEDNFGTAFAGKYDSIFCPNQSTVDKNLKELIAAIARVYASVLNPDALLYRRSKGLTDYDERMALLIQFVEGERCGDYLMPHAAGVAFSRNVFRWAPQIRSEDGFVRLVWGLGTRAVDRVGNDYPRLIALSHPLLRPSNDPKSIRRYSQQYIDLIDLKNNTFTTLPVHEVMTTDYAPLRYIAQVEEDGYFESMRSSIISDPSRLVLTFDVLLQRTPFAGRMKAVLRSLEQAYHSPVDVEFTLKINEDEQHAPQLKLTILQCRPQVQLQQTEVTELPADLEPARMLFSTEFMVPQGKVDDIRWVVYVVPEGYFAMTSTQQRTSLARAVGGVNAMLKEQAFICIGPGRWGSSNSDLGVPIAYGDIYNSRALVELAGEHCGLPPEPSLGTHFFQDLLEAQIYPLALQLDDPGTVFQKELLEAAPNHLREFLPGAEELECCLRVARVEDLAPGQRLYLVMNEEIGKAVAWFQKPK